MKTQQQQQQQQQPTNQQPTAKRSIEFKLINVKGVSLDNFESIDVANAVCLGKYSVNSKGEDVINMVALTGLKRTDKLDQVKHLLLGLIAEYNWRHGFEREYIKVAFEDKELKVGVTAERFFTKYLSTSVIFRTDSKGRFTDDPIEINGKLNRTALKLTEKHGLVNTTTRDEFRTVLHHHAKAVCAQFRTLEDLNEALDKVVIEAGLSNVTTAKAINNVAGKGKGKGKKATTTATTLTTEPATEPATATA